MLESLGTICEKCSGVGTWEKVKYPERPYYTVTRLCEQCHGAGLIPTEDGKKVLDFMRKFLKQTSVQCPRCGGSGKERYYNDDCHYCKEGYRTTQALWHDDDE